MRHRLLPLLFLWWMGANAVAEPIPGAPTAWVTDRVGVLSSGTAKNINEQLRDYEARSGHQVIVWIDRSTGDSSLEEWSANAFTSWKIGREGIDDGVALFLFMEDRRARIEVGYGLEGVLPDALASRIIQEQLLPQINNPDAAVSSSIDAILAALGDTQSNKTNVEQTPELDKTQAIGATILGVLFLLLLFIRPQWALWLLFNLVLRGGGGGGGGFSGRGGRSGGGGASGSW